MNKTFLLALACVFAATCANAQEADLDRIAKDASDAILQPSDQRMLELKKTHEAQLKRAFGDTLKNMSDNEKKKMIKALDSTNKAAARNLARPEGLDDDEIIVDEISPAGKVDYTNQQDVEEYLKQVMDTSTYEPIANLKPAATEGEESAEDTQEDTKEAEKSAE